MGKYSFIYISLPILVFYYLYSGTYENSTIPEYYIVPVLLLFGIDDLILFIVYVIVMIIYYLFFYDYGGMPDSTERPQELSVVLVTVSDPIPVLFGTKFIRQANIVWYGDVKSTPWEKCYG